MSIDPKIALEKSIFDVRGKNLNPEDFYQLGVNLVRATNKENPLIVSAADHRKDSAVLIKSLEKGILDADGINLSLGFDIPKPVVHFAGKRYNADTVVYITASHLNEEYNGVKVTSRKKSIKTNGSLPSNPREESLNFYKNYMKETFGANMGQRQTVAIDSLYGTSSGLAQEVFENSGYAVIGVHNYLDRRAKKLYEHSPDPHLPKNLEELMKICRNLRCWGAAFDGDMDRVCFVDESGERVEEDEITMIISDYLIEKEKQKKSWNAGKKPKIVYEIKSSHAVPEAIIMSGGEPIIEKTGWLNISETMLSSGAIFAGEISGHYSINSYYIPGGDDGLFTALIVGKILSEKRKKLKEIREMFPKYFTSPEMRIDYSKKRNPEVVKTLEDLFRKEDYKIIKKGSDIRIEKYDNKKNWESLLVIRTSNTEAQKITIRFGGRTFKNLDGIVEEFIEKIPKRDSKLRQIISGLYEESVKTGTYGEIVDIVNDSDEVIKRDALSKAHSEGLRHRCVHILAINPINKKILVSQRGSKKERSPLKLHVSAGGYVKTGESYREASIRELKEELFHEQELPKGVTLKKIGEYKNDTRETNKENVALFIAEYSGHFFPDPYEIKKVEWKDLDKINKDIRISPDKYSQSFRNAIRKYQEYLESINCEIKHSKKDKRRIKQLKF